jgi:large-conductance mechanosensitive channel
MNNKKSSIPKKYMINVSVLSSVIILVISTIFNQYMTQLFKDVIDPIFSKDLNYENKPDLYYVNRVNVTILNTTFPLGNIIYNTVMVIIKIVALYYIIKNIIEYMEK